MMEIEFSKHALRKQEILKDLGWDISLDLIKNTIKNPSLTNKTRENQPTAISPLDGKHILRVVYEIRSGIIIVITFYVSRKGRYGT